MTPARVDLDTLDDEALGRLLSENIDRAILKHVNRLGLSGRRAFVRQSEFDKATSEDTSALVDGYLHFAYYFAASDEYMRAGKVYRAYLRNQPRLVQAVKAAYSQARIQVQRHRNLMDALQRQIEKIQHWNEVGLAIRKRESWPMSNNKLAEQIHEEADDALNGSVSAIRKEIPLIGLDADVWREKARELDRQKRGNVSSASLRETSRKNGHKTATYGRHKKRALIARRG